MKHVSRLARRSPWEKIALIREIQRVFVELEIASANQDCPAATNFGIRRLHVNLEYVQRG
jgi:hypothetical protein